MTGLAQLSRAADVKDVTFARALEGAMDTVLGLPTGTATDLLLVRHAETDFAASAAGGASADPFLSERGRCQAMRLAIRLRLQGIEAVYTSTSRAAIETATIAAAARDLPVARIADLRDLELDPSELNGVSRDRRKLETELCVRFINNPRWDSLRGVESSRGFRHRTIQAIEAIAAENEGRRVAVITHQPNINAYISMVLGIGRDMFFRAEFTSISTVRILRDLYGVQGINDYSHLLQRTGK